MAIVLMPRIQFHLRTLLLVTLALGCGLGWWFRPYTIEEHWPSGELKSQLHVRRSWNGEVITNGQQSWWWSNGQLARRGESYGYELTEFGFSGKRMAYSAGMPLDGEQMHNAQGKTVEPVGVEFALLWMHFHDELNDHWELSASDQFAETPHVPGDASTGGSIMINTP